MTSGTVSTIPGGLEMLEDQLVRRFDKILVARHSPQNDCCAAEGDLLYPPVSKKESHARHGDKYYFQSVSHDHKRSKFGWVKRIEKPLSVEEIVSKHPVIERSDQQHKLLENLLTAIARLPEDTPVAGSYFRRIEPPYVELTFHKVFFYPERVQASNPE